MKATFYFSLSQYFKIKNDEIKGKNPTKEKKRILNLKKQNRATREVLIKLECISRGARRSK
jgi:hypothetical protein